MMKKEKKSKKATSVALPHPPGKKDDKEPMT